MKLSTHFSLEELCRSEVADRHGIDNAPPRHIVDNLKSLCVGVLEPLRIQVGSPIIVTSGYRCPKLNNLVGGKHHSQHMLGFAADIHVDGMPTEHLARCVETSGLDFDQLGREFLDDADPFAGWVHVSHLPSPARNRRLLFWVPTREGR